MDAKTESLSNISEKIVVLAATGIARDVTVIEAGKGGTPANLDIKKASIGININLTNEERYTLQSLNKLGRLAVLITPPTISIDKGMVISPTASIALSIVAGIGIRKRKTIVPANTAMIDGLDNTLFMVLIFVSLDPNMMYP